MSLQSIFSNQGSVASKISAITNLQLTSANIPGLTKLATNGVGSFVSNFTKNDFQVVANAKAKAAGKSPEEADSEEPSFIGALIYPIDLKYYVRFHFTKYKRVNVFVDAIELPIVDIILPMPANIQENFNVQYQTSGLGPAAGQLNDLAKSILATPPGELVSKAAEFGKDYMTILSKLAGFGVVGAIGAAKSVNESISSATQLTVGAAINPHLAVVLTGVDLRRHQFRFLFTPNSKKEVIMIKEIIRTFKKHMLPYYADGGLLLGYPDEVAITFGPESNPVYKIKKCVMTDLVVNYAPSNVPAFFNTGDPVAIMVDMAFTETEQFTRKEIPEGPSDKGESFISTPYTPSGER